MDSNCFENTKRGKSFILKYKTVANSGMAVKKQNHFTKLGAKSQRLEAFTF